MTRIKAKDMSLEAIEETFRTRYSRTPEKCWLWKSELFRFRHGSILYNPRRLAAQIEGYAIPAGRNLKPACRNPQCVNPAHTVLMHNGAPLNMNSVLYLEMTDFQLHNRKLAKMYFAEQPVIQEARNRTLDLVIAVKKRKLPIAKFAEIYGVSEQYISRMKKVTVGEFNMMKIDPASIYDPEEFTEEEDPTLSQFVR